MRIHRTGPWLFQVGLVAGLWTGCATSQKVSENKTESLTQHLSPEQQQAVKEFEAELEMGRNMAGHLLQQFKPLENKELTAYVTKKSAW